MRKTTKISLVIYSALIFAVVGPKDAVGQAASFSELTSTDIKNQMHNDEFILIEVGDNSVPILVYASQQPITKGLVFIIGDADMSLGRKDSLVNIAKRLPAIGWTTVVLPSLGLSLGPNIAFPIVEELADEEQNADTAIEASPGEEIVDPTQVEPEQQSESSSQVESENERINRSSPMLSITEADLSLYAIEIEAYLSAAVSHMSSTMGHRIIVSQGISAATISKLIADETPSLANIDALVVNNPYWPIRKLNNKIPMVIAQTPIPLLDLTSHWDNSWSKQTQSARKIRAKTDLKEIYRQTDIIGQSLDEAQMDYITRQIRGWTTYLGW